MTVASQDKVSADADADVVAKPGPDQATEGPGAAALAKLLAAGNPTPQAVLEVLYAHPAEHQALLGQLHGTLGNAFVQQVIAADASGKGVLAAAASLPADGGGPEVPTPKPLGPGVTQLAELIAKGTPSVDEVVKILDLHPGEREMLVDTIGTYLGDEFLIKCRERMPDLRMHWGALHLVAGDPLAEGGSFFEASRTRKGAAWRTPLFGGTFTGEVGGKVGYDIRQDFGGGNYISASKKEDGGSWHLGDFTGTFSGGKLDSAYALTDTDSLRLHYGTKAGFGTLGYYRAGELQGVEIAGGYKGSDDYQIGIQRPFALGEGLGTAGLRHKVDGGVGRDVATFDYAGKDNSLQSFAGLNSSTGDFTAGLNTQHKLDDATQLRSRFSVEGDTYGMGLSADHRWNPQWSSSASGDLSTERYAFGASTQYKQGGLQLDGSGKVSGAWDGPAQFDLGFTERYRSDRFQQDFSLTGRLAEGHDQINARAGFDADLGSGFYAGAWGNWQAGEGISPTASLGASITFTPHERAALTLVGIVDERGAFDTRLELDIFKSKIRGLDSLTSHRKDAIIGLFVQYGNGGGMLDDRYGGADQGFGIDDSGQLSFGIKFGF
ncbi:MAG: hypothetical protein R2939_03455 [Kofleriaceae bacterium]